MKTAKIVFSFFLVLLLLIGFFIEWHKSYFPWDSIPGFYALFGFVACLLIVALAKFLGRVWLSKKEDYYE